MNVLLSTTTIDSQADFAEYHNGVEAAYEQITGGKTSVFQEVYYNDY